jgi:hypothetical protein
MAAPLCWGPAVRRSWRQAVVLALVGGLLGGVALGALAGARRTATAYGRYLASINASDVFVNVPGVLPGMSVQRPITLISTLPGVLSHGAALGLNGLPVFHGRVDDSFLDSSLNGALHSEFFGQDRLSVLAGKLPAPGTTSEIVLTPAIASRFGVGVGGRVTYAYQSLGPHGQPLGRPFYRSYRVAAIAEIPPALADEADAEQAAILPPGATRQVLAGYAYAWIGLRLARGGAGVPELQRELATLASRLERQASQATHRNISGLVFSIRRTDAVHEQVQQAIMPEAVALSVFGAIAGLAMLVLVGQGLIQLISRSARDAAVLRALGATQGQIALCLGLPGVIPVLGGTVLAVVGAVAVSPLAPVGPVRRYDPSRGVHVDALVLGRAARSWRSCCLDYWLSWPRGPRVPAHLGQRPGHRWSPRRPLPLACRRPPWWALATRSSPGRVPGRCRCGRPSSAPRPRSWRWSPRWCSTPA